MVGESRVKRPSSVPEAMDAKWMSERAAIVFATTLDEDYGWPTGGNDSSMTHHRVGVSYHIPQLIQESIVHDQLRL